MTSKTSTKTFSQQKHSDPPMLWIAAILGSVFLHGFIFWILRLSMIRSQIVSESRSAAVNLVEIVPAKKTLQPTPTNKAQILPSASTKTLPSKSIIVAKIVAKKINKPIGFNSVKTSKIQNNTIQKPVLKRNNLRKNVSPQKLSNTKSFVAVVPSKTKAIKQQVSRRSFVKIPLITSKYAIKSIIVTQSKPQSIIPSKVASKSQAKPQSIITSKSASKSQPKPQSIIASQPASKSQPKPQSIVTSKSASKPQPKLQSRTFPKIVIRYQQNSKSRIYQKNVIKKPQISNSAIAKRPVVKQQSLAKKTIAQKLVSQTQQQPQSIVASNPVIEPQPQPQSIVATKPVSGQEERPQSIVDRQPVIQERSTPKSTVTQEPIAIVDPVATSEPNISPKLNSEPIEKSNISPEPNSEPIEKPAPKPSISPQPVPIPFPRPIASPAPIRQPVPIPFPRPIASPAPIRQPIPFPRPTSPLPNPRPPVRTPQPRESSGVVATLDLSSIRGGNRDIPDQLARPKQNQKQFLSVIDGVQIGSSVVTLDVSLQIDDRGRLAAIGNVKASSSQGSSGGKNINFEAIARKLFRDWEFQPARSGGKPVYSELSLRVTIKPLFGRI